MLYAHYEGFCRSALSIYADAINKEHIACGEAVTCIAASSLASKFKDFENFERKSSLFKRLLPDDTQLHRFTRRAELLEVLGDIWTQQVDIPISDVVNTEANLWPIVLRKILYCLGFDHEAMKDFEGGIFHLLNWRNDIAHGTRRDGLEDHQFSDVENAAYGIMDELVRVVTEALAAEAFRKAPAAA